MDRETVPPVMRSPAPAIVRGSIADRPWGVTLALIAGSPRPCELVVTAADGKIYRTAFAGGLVVGASSPLAADSVSRVALTSHLIMSSQAVDLSRRLAGVPEREEITVFAQAARLSRDQAEGLRRRVIAQRAARTFSIDRGQLVVEDQISVPTTLDSQLDIRSVIFSGVRMHLSAQRLTEDLRQLGSRFILASEDLAGFGFTDAELPIIAALRLGTSLPELEAMHREIDPRTMQAALYALAACGAVKSMTSTVASVATRAQAQAAREPTVSRIPTPREPTMSRIPTPREPTVSRIPTAREPMVSHRRSSPPPVPTVSRVPTQRPPTISRTPTPRAPSVSRTPTTPDLRPATEAFGESLTRFRTPSTPPPAAAPAAAEAFGESPTKFRTPTTPPAAPPAAEAFGESPTKFRTPTTPPAAPAAAEAFGESPTKFRTPTTPPAAVAAPVVAPAAAEAFGESPTKFRTSTTPPPAVAPPAVARTASAPSVGPAAESFTDTRTTTIRPNALTVSELETLIRERVALVDKGGDHFAVLGVPVGATIDEIRAAYVELSRNLQPGNLAALGIQDESFNAQRLFAQIGIAFTVLTDPTRRADYVASLAKIKPSRTISDLEATMHARAREAFHRAEIALGADEPARAVSELRAACELDPGNVDYFGMLGWAQFCAAKDKSCVVGETRKALEKAIFRSQTPEVPRFFLGRVERMLGHDDKALRHFREVLVLQPRHRDAASEIRIIESRLARGTKPPKTR